LNGGIIFWGVLIESRDYCNGTDSIEGMVCGKGGRGGSLLALILLLLLVIGILSLGELMTNSTGLSSPNYFSFSLPLLLQLFCDYLNFSSRLPSPLFLSYGELIIKRGPSRYKLFLFLSGKTNQFIIFFLPFISFWGIYITSFW
jgi:hypothetical protein